MLELTVQAHYPGAAPVTEAAPAPGRPRHPLDRLLAPERPIALHDPSWGHDLGPAERLVECVVGDANRAGCRAADWRLFARIGEPGGLDGEEVIEPFTVESGEPAPSYVAGDGRVMVPFGFADAYAGYTAELWAGASGQRRLNPGALDAFYRVKRAIPRGAPAGGSPAAGPLAGQARSFLRWPFDASVAAAAALLRPLRR